jgi:V/A-type H+-transporting ATPase subunit A
VAGDWWSEQNPEWEGIRARALRLLEEASEIEETARIIGEKALPDEQRLVLLMAELLREGFLVQNAFHEVDRYCAPEKQSALLEAFVGFHALAAPLVRKGIPIEQIRELDVLRELMRLKEREGVEPIKEAKHQMKMEVDDLAIKYEVAM